MYECMKKLQPFAEQIGTVISCKCEVNDRKFFDYDEIKFEGMTSEGRPFAIKVEVKDKE